MAAESGIDVLGSEGLAVHQEELDVLLVVDKERLVAGGHHVTGLLRGTVANLGHSSPATETPADSAVNTLGLAPGLGDYIPNATSVEFEV